MIVTFTLTHKLIACLIATGYGAAWFVRLIHWLDSGGHAR